MLETTEGAFKNA